MLDTHAVARSLTDAEFTPAQADAITNAVRQAAEHGDQVTSDQFKTSLAELRTEMAGQRAELTGQITEVHAVSPSGRRVLSSGADCIANNLPDDPHIRLFPNRPYGMRKPDADAVRRFRSALRGLPRALRTA